MPHALRFMPGLLDAVKSAVAREAAQLFDKLSYVANKVGTASRVFCFHCGEGEGVKQVPVVLAGLRLHTPSHRWSQKGSVNHCPLL